jgi:hypothetical protein
MRAARQRRSPARISYSVRPRRTTIGWITPRADRIGELGERGLVHARARLVLAGASDRPELRSRPPPGALARRRPAARRAAPIPCWLIAAPPRHLDAAAPRAAFARDLEVAIAPFEAGREQHGLAKDGASAMRMLRGITVSKTLSP